MANKNNFFINIKKTITALLFIFLFLTLSAFAISQEPYPFTSQEDATRFSALTNEIRCVVCQNENIADSSAPIAIDMREKVYRMVLDKKSNDDIKNFLTARYGDYILLRPRVNKLTWFLWAFPFAALAIVFIIRRRKKTNQTQAA